MSFSSYTQTPEFKRATSNATDSAIKGLFKGISIVIAETAKFIKQMLMQIVGK